jgi:NAD(P)-dependent dehydrogenase (short-subunit alcohol dehydrogenase family)
VRLENRIAIVTGVGGQNGAAIALGFAREGADLVAVDEDDAKAEEVARKARDLGRKALALRVDVTSKPEVTEMVRRVVSEFGRIDILMNATGVSHNQAFLTFSEADFDHALAVGLKAFFLTSQAVGRLMAEQASGKIINLTSITGRLGSGEAVAWCTTRSGVDAMTRALGQALGYYGVNVNALAHGGVEDGPYPEKAETAERRRRIPLGRLGYPEDLVGPAIFLASDDANFVVGETLYVDGGYTTAAVTEDQFRPEWARAEHTADGPRTDRYARRRPGGEA